MEEPVLIQDDVKKDPGK
jgi:hypothetical protein